MLPQTHPEPARARRQHQCSPHAHRPTPAEILQVGERYADLRDRRLADTLITEDAAEDREELSPFDRITCHAHRRWAHECISSPLHIIVITGHRWCRQCQAEATVAIDELTGNVTVTCTRCHHAPNTPATRQILRTCRTSLATALEHRRTRETKYAPAA